MMVVSWRRDVKEDGKFVGVGRGTRPNVSGAVRTVDRQADKPNRFGGNHLGLPRLRRVVYVYNRVYRECRKNAEGENELKSVLVRIKNKKEFIIKMKEEKTHIHYK